MQKTNSLQEMSYFSLPERAHNMMSITSPIMRWNGIVNHCRNNKSIMNNSHQKSWKLDNLLSVLILFSQNRKMRGRSVRLDFNWLYSQLPVAFTHRWLIVVFRSCLSYLAKLNRRQRCLLSPDTLVFIMGKSKWELFHLQSAILRHYHLITILKSHYRSLICGSNNAV